MISNALFSEQETPAITDNEYYQCNFSCKVPQEENGKVVGVPLNAVARFVECNLINRCPKEGSILVRCNTSIVSFGDVIGEGIFADIVYGYYNNETLQAVYYDEPKVLNARMAEGN